VADNNRYIVEQKLGRKLLKTEHVHHINGIKTDNRVENLAVLPESLHHKIHGKNRLLPTLKCIFMVHRLNNGERTVLEKQQLQKRREELRKEYIRTNLRPSTYVHFFVRFLYRLFW
jgi:hypothetical protein